MKILDVLAIVSLGLLSLSSLPASAEVCEHRTLSGIHSAVTELEAKLGAWEDVSELCYPGLSRSDSIDCEKTDMPQDSGESILVVNCVQNITCTICSDALVRLIESQE